jgi:hypothetical protein
MANNRYYLYCDCGEKLYLGKSLGDGIYTWRDPGEDQVKTFSWMWEHLMDCKHPNATGPDSLGPEWVSGEIFKVLTEGDPRIK